MRLQWLCLLWFALLVGVACAKAEEVRDHTPIGAVQAFLDALARSDWDETALGDAYRLLAAPTREALEERAKRASTLGPKTFSPSDMIVQGRFRLRFKPRSKDGYSETVYGNKATVTVRGTKTGDEAKMDLVREGARWRILVALPPLDRAN